MTTKVVLLFTEEVGKRDGTKVGALGTVGAAEVGATDGTTDGPAEGAVVGTTEGNCVGLADGQ